MKDIQQSVAEYLISNARKENPFKKRNHISNWDHIEQEAESLEKANECLEIQDLPKELTIQALLDRWEIGLTNCALVAEYFSHLQNAYLLKINNGGNKKIIIDSEIALSSQYKLNDTPETLKSGYRNKGFKWFERGQDFSLKDFVIYVPETASYLEFDASKPYVITLTPEMKENAPLRELYFLYAAEGYAYAKYVHFLQREFNNTGKVSLETAISADNLKVIRNELISGKYIDNIPENDFLYLFSGQPLLNNLKIKWLFSKKMGYYFFQKICINFKLETLNNWVNTKHKPFDSNDKPATGYKQIDDLMAFCDPAK